MRFYTHAFGDNRTLDYVVRQAEIIRRYQWLVAEMLEARPPYVFGGDQTLAAWLEGVEAHVVADALAQCGGNHARAMTLLGESSRRHFGRDAELRRQYAQRTFADVVAARHRSGQFQRHPPGPRRRAKGVATV